MLTLLLFLCCPLWVMATPLPIPHPHNDRCGVPGCHAQVSTRWTSALRSDLAASIVSCVEDPRRRFACWSCCSTTRNKKVQHCANDLCQGMDRRPRILKPGQTKLVPTDWDAVGLTAAGFSINRVRLSTNGRRTCKVCWKRGDRLCRQPMVPEVTPRKPASGKGKRKAAATPVVTPAPGPRGAASSGPPSPAAAAKPAALGVVAGPKISSAFATKVNRRRGAKKKARQRTPAKAPPSAATVAWSVDGHAVGPPRPSRTSAPTRTSTLRQPVADVFVAAPYTVVPTSMVVDKMVNGTACSDCGGTSTTAASAAVDAGVTYFWVDCGHCGAETSVRPTCPVSRASAEPRVYVWDPALLRDVFAHFIAGRTYAEYANVTTDAGRQAIKEHQWRDLLAFWCVDVVAPVFEEAMQRGLNRVLSRHASALGGRDRAFIKCDGFYAVRNKKKSCGASPHGSVVFVDGLEGVLVHCVQLSRQDDTVNGIPLATDAEGKPVEAQHLEGLATEQGLRYLKDQGIWVEVSAAPLPKLLWLCSN